MVHPVTSSNSNPRNSNGKLDSTDFEDWDAEEVETATTSASAIPKEKNTPKSCEMGTRDNDQTSVLAQRWDKSTARTLNQADEIEDRGDEGRAQNSTGTWPVPSLSESTRNKREGRNAKEHAAPTYKSLPADMCNDEEDWDNEQPQSPSKCKASEHNAASSGEEEDWVYEKDGKMTGDKRDERRQMPISFQKMTEREREEEIFRRMEQRETEMTRREIARKLKGTEAGEDFTLVADGVMDESDDDTRLDTAMRRTDKKKLKVRDLFGDIEEEGSKMPSVKTPDQLISEVSQLEAIRLSRFRLERWLHMPYFRQRVVGFYVRVNIGANNNNKTVYRAAKIVDIREQEKPYLIEKLKTNKILRLAICDKERSFKIAYVSNQPFTEAEFDRWTSEFKRCGLPLPRVSEINEKVADFNYCESYNMTEAEINEMAAERQKFNKVPVNYSQLKAALSDQLESARLSEDEPQIRELEAKLAEVISVCNERDKAMREGVQTLSTEQRIKLMNEREQLVGREIREDLAKKNDPFVRRRTLPTMIRFANSVTLKAEVRERLLAEKRKQNQTIESPKRPVEPIKEEAKPIIEAEEEPDLHALHDFELDIDLQI